MSKKGVNLPMPNGNFRYEYENDVYTVFHHGNIFLTIEKDGELWKASPVSMTFQSEFNPVYANSPREAFIRVIVNFADDIKEIYEFYNELVIGIRAKLKISRT